MKLKLTYAGFLITSIFSSNIQLHAVNGFYGQWGQDKYAIEAIFKFKKNGFFVDIGAHDGMTDSNSYYFEKYLGWNGICIEPRADKFEVLKKNRKCICIQGCIYHQAGEKNFLKINGPGELYSGLIDSYDPKHIKRIDEEMQVYGGNKEIVKVKAYRFNDICKKYKIKRIDFLSIDTEGCEEQIIKSIDFDNIYIEALTVENNYNNPAIGEHLRKKGYEFCCRLCVDDVYKKKKK